MKAHAKRVFTPSILKKNSTHQRADVSLTKELASALVQSILSGKTLFPPSGKIEIVLIREEGYKALILSTNTLNSWVKRGTVIHETGEALRDVLDEARVTYRTRKIIEKKKGMIRELEKHFYRTIRIKTKLPLRDKAGKAIQREDGSLVRQENAELLRVKMKTAMFLAERLMPEVYGKKVNGGSKQIALSLSDLRRAKEGSIAPVVWSK